MYGWGVCGMRGRQCVPLYDRVGLRCMSVWVCGMKSVCVCVYIGLWDVRSRFVCVCMTCVACMRVCEC